MLVFIVTTVHLSVLLSLPTIVDLIEPKFQKATTAVVELHSIMKYMKTTIATQYNLFSPSTDFVLIMYDMSPRTLQSAHCGCILKLVNNL